MIHILDLKIRATGNDFPETRFIGEMPDLFDFQIGEMIHHLNLITPFLPSPIPSTAPSSAPTQKQIPSNRILG